MTLRMLTAVLACTLATYSSQARAQAIESPDPKLSLAISEFHAFWQTAWQISEDLRRADAAPDLLRERRKYAHCHSEWFLEPLSQPSFAEQQHYGFVGEQYTMIKSAVGGFALCPTWMLSSTPNEADAKTAGVDGPIVGSLKPVVVGARHRLLRILESSWPQDSSSPWLAGQIVRFRLDAGDQTGALKIAQSCSRPVWWCNALIGLALARQENVPEAEQAFRRMLTSMPDSLRCEWEDMSMLLIEKNRAIYQEQQCSDRDSLNTRIWWLADPLYRVRGNDRLVAQHVRQIETVLRQHTLQSERFRFDVARGGDAIAAVLRRYGWPTYAAWSGVVEDRGHSGYLASHLHETAPSPPYTTFEYSLGRVHTIPDWSAVITPFKSTSASWTLSVEEEDGSPSSKWWPQEHFRPARRLVQLPDGQAVRIRRQDFVEVATAVPLTHPAIRNVDEDFDVMLLSTRGPDAVDSIAQEVAHSGRTVFLRGRFPSGPSLLAVEALGIGAIAIDSRTRYGFEVPQPLAALAPGEIALSDIALLSPLDDDVATAPHDSLLQFMLPSNRLAADARMVSLYWESYGLQPDDSASVTLRIASESYIGLLRRIGMMTGLASDPTSVVMLHWKQHETHGGVTVLKGPVSVHMHALNLNLQQLNPGKYVIEMEVKLSDGRTATSATTLWLTP